MYSVKSQARHTSDDADLGNLFDGPERELTEADKALLDDIFDGLDEIVAEQPDEPSATATAAPPLQAAFVAWRIKDAGFRARQAALRLALKPLQRPAELPADPAPDVHPSQYSKFLGVSERTVRRRKRQGMAASEMFAPVHPLEHDGIRFSIREFARTFGMRQDRISAGIKAGLNAAQILESRRSRGRPVRSKLNECV